jgi:hypothetical protein
LTLEQPRSTISDKERVNSSHTPYLASSGISSWSTSAILGTASFVIIWRTHELLENVTKFEHPAQIIATYLATLLSSQKYSNLEVILGGQLLFHEFLDGIDDGTSSATESSHQVPARSELPFRLTRPSSRLLRCVPLTWSSPW